MIKSCELVRCTYYKDNKCSYEKDFCVHNSEEMENSMRNSYIDSKQAYQNCPTYRAVVDMMVGAIENLQLTPDEVRSAAMLACIIFEQHRTEPRPNKDNIK